MVEYTPIYSNFGRIKNRIPQIDVNMMPQILAYQAYIDSEINSVLRAVLGSNDKNGFRIILPLTGTYNAIDIRTMNITLHLDADIEMAADDCVIAKFRQDTAENDDKVKQAEERLWDTIYHHYGRPISIPHDLSTDYLAANKLLNSMGVPIELSDNSGVLLWKY